MHWWNCKDGNSYLKVFIQANSKQNEVVGEDPRGLRIRIQAPPIDNKANLELCAFVAKELGIAKSLIHIIRGKTSKIKILRINEIHNPPSHWVKP